MDVLRWISSVRLRLRSLMRRRRVEADLEDEIRDHLDRQTALEMARGLSAEEARCAALRAFGGVEQRKEECRDARRVNSLECFVQDLRLAFRALARNPGFATAAILTLALGIGANAAVFAVVNGVLLRAMPFPDPDRVFLVSFIPQRGPFKMGLSLADADFLNFRRSDHLFEHLATFGNTSVAISGRGEPVRVAGAKATADFFAVLGVRAELGRTFSAGDALEHVVVLSDKLWRGRFDADRRVIGTPVTIDGVTHTVIGVMPTGFDFPNKTQFWSPFEVRLDPHMSFSWPVIGRLKANATPPQAQAELEAWAAPRLRQQVVAADVARIFPVKDLLVSDIRRPLAIFSGAVAFVLLIACANVANLLLTRAVARRQEMAVRTALGARRGRLIRQLLTENAVLALIAAGIGTACAYWTVPGLIALAPKGSIPRIDLIQTDGRVLTFVLGLSIATSLLFGLAPALQATRYERRASLLPAGRPFAMRHDWLRGALIVCEIALTLVLLTGAGLMVKSFLRLRAVDPGFRAEHVAIVNVDLPEIAYPTARAIQAFHTEALARLAALPGVTRVAAVNWLPLGGHLTMGDFVIEGRTARPGFNVDKLCVSEGYFRTMGIRLLGGRDFSDRDRAGSPGVAIISESVARRLWPGENPIGKRISNEDQPRLEDWLTIIGVVDEVKQQGLGAESHAALYQTYLQVDRSGWLSHMTMAIQTPSDPLRLAPAARAIFRGLDGNLPVADMTTMPALIEATTAEPRFQTRLLALFAILAFALAVVGVYGVIAHAVVQRTREIGIRVALGAATSTVVWMVFRRTLVLLGAGVAIGLAGAAGLTRVLEQFLFDVKPGDPATLVAVSGLLLAAACLAAWIPARRAARVDPLTALRHE